MHDLAADYGQSGFLSSGRLAETAQTPAGERQIEEQAKPFAKTALQQRPESVGWCALGILRKADTRQWLWKTLAPSEPYRFDPNRS
jgi:hypothetical protein